MSPRPSPIACSNRKDSSSSAPLQPGPAIAMTKAITPRISVTYTPPLEAPGVNRGSSTTQPPMSNRGILPTPFFCKSSRFSVLFCIVLTKVPTLTISPLGTLQLHNRGYAPFLTWQPTIFECYTAMNSFDATALPPSQTRKTLIPHTSLPLNLATRPINPVDLTSPECYS